MRDRITKEDASVRRVKGFLQWITRGVIPRHPVDRPGLLSAVALLFCWFENCGMFTEQLGRIVAKPSEGQEARC